MCGLGVEDAGQLGEEGGALSLVDQNVSWDLAFILPSTAELEGEVEAYLFEDLVQLVFYPTLFFARLRLDVGL